MNIHEHDKKLRSMMSNHGILIIGIYQVLAKTARYAVVLVNGNPRVENLKGMYHELVPHVEIPVELADEYLGYLLGYKDADKGYKRETKADGVRQFNLECDEMFDMEHTELYPESVL